MAKGMWQDIPSGIKIVVLGGRVMEVGELISKLVDPGQGIGGRTAMG